MTVNYRESHGMCTCSGNLLSHDSAPRGASREFLYVDDCARAIVLATERYGKPEPVNIGAGREITIKDLVNLIAELTGFRGAIRWDRAKPDGQPRRSLDVSRAEREFGFRTQISFEDGLRHTIDWYRAEGRAAGGSAVG